MQIGSGKIGAEQKRSVGSGGKAAAEEIELPRLVQTFKNRPHSLPAHFSSSAGCAINRTAEGEGPRGGRAPHIVLRLLVAARSHQRHRDLQGPIPRRQVERRPSVLRSKERRGPRSERRRPRRGSRLVALPKWRGIADISVQEAIEQISNSGRRVKGQKLQGECAQRPLRRFRGARM